MKKTKKKDGEHFILAIGFRVVKKGKKEVPIFDTFCLKPAGKPKRSYIKKEWKEKPFVERLKEER